MSHNKTIKLYHKITGKSYKQCRAELKACHWDILSALLPSFNELCKTVNQIVNSISDALTCFVNAVVEIANQIRDSINTALTDTTDTVSYD